MRAKKRIQFFFFAEVLLNAWKFRGFQFAARLVWYGFKARFLTVGKGLFRCFGLKLHFRNRESVLHMLTELFGMNVYYFESAEEAPTVIDAGSNIGDSLLYFKQLYPSATVLCFEPHPAALELLRQNLEANAFKDVKVFPFALGSSDREARHSFVEDGSYLGNTERPELRAAMDAQGQARSAHASFTVQTRRLSQVPEVQRCGRIDLLKLDIEGAEADVVKDMEPFLGNVENVIIETHAIPGSPDRSGGMRQLFERAGFEVCTSGVYRGGDNFTHPLVSYLIGRRTKSK